MKKLMVLTAGLLLSSLTVSAESYWQADTSPPRFCLQNFNAYGPIYAKDIFERTERMTSELQAIPKCDVVQLQEVWNESQITQIEKDLKRQYKMSTPNKTARIGVMSLFMEDIISEDTQTFNINNENGVLDSIREAFDVKKAFHIVRSSFFEVNETFQFVNTHLHPTSQPVRLTQILDMVQWRLKHQDEKLLLTGDLNADPGSAEHRLVKYVLGMNDSLELHLNGYPKGVCTYCTGNPRGWMFTNHVFDYIFFSNVGESQSTLKVLSSQVNMRGTPRRPLSDHFGVRTQFSIDPVKAEVTTAQIEMRRQKALEVLDETQRIFSGPDAKKFEDYRNLVLEMQMQLQAGGGSFYEYFMKFR